MKAFKTFIVSISLMAMSMAVWAGESEKDLKYELTFIAMKLLEKSGKDEVTYSHEATAKPFIGICTNYKNEGVELTCITPGHGAEKAGLKTGDLVTHVNGESVAGMRNHSWNDHKKSDKPYMKMINEMQPGDEFVFTVIRGGKAPKDYTVTIGVLNQPAYTITISKE